MSVPSLRSVQTSLAGRRLSALASRGPQPLAGKVDPELISAGLAESRPDGSVAITAAGLAHLARRGHAGRDSAVGAYRAQHLALAPVPGEQAGLMDEAESPLLWLARRKGRDGRPLIDPVQLLAGERLRQDFTRGHMTPRVTASWESPVSGSRNGGGDGNITEMVIAAQQRVSHALEAVGPEFSGLLMDVCCFLKRLEDVERERIWPARSGKVVLQLGLDRLARHYGLRQEARGPSRGDIRTWLAPDAALAVERPEV